VSTVVEKVYDAFGNYINKPQKRQPSFRDSIEAKAREQKKEKEINTSKPKPIEPTAPSRPNPQPPVEARPKVISPKSKRVRPQTKEESNSLHSRYYPKVFGFRKKRYRRNNKVFVS
jgi:hypothetical protein